MHEIDVDANGRARIFSAREPMWHGLGTVTDDVLTAADAIQVAGMDWTVEKQPVFRLNGNGEYVGVKDRFALVRDVDDFELSIVSDVYKPFQNRDAFSFMDTLVASGGPQYETAGALRHGRVVFLTMKMPERLKAAGDDIDVYLLLRTTHDGSGRISVYIVTIRVVCMNTLTMSIRSAKHEWGVTHASDPTTKVREAREALELSDRYGNAFTKRADALASVKISDTDAVALLESAMPDKPRRDDVIDSIMENYRTSVTVGSEHLGTGWGFINGLTEWQEHKKVNASDQALFSRTLNGENFKLRSTIADRILAMA